MAKNNKSSGGHASQSGNRGIYGSLRLLLHLIAAVQFAYAVYYDYTYVRFEPKRSETPGIPGTSFGSKFGGKFKYLTFLDAILQTIYFTIALANDIFGTNEAAPKRLPFIRKLKDFFMTAYAFPIALNVGITFWTIYAIDRELIFPRALDAVFPSWLNHVMHTNIVVFIVLELFTSFRVYPRRNRGLLALCTFMLSYLVWIHIVKLNSGLWVYPILDVLNLPQRIVFFIAVLIFTIFLYLVGETINNFIWAKELKLTQKKVK